MLSEYNSLSIAFFGVFWMLGIFLLIVLIAMLCKEKSE
jgi:cbb3-type cytochrome oxidase subunit 3